MEFKDAIVDYRARHDMTQKAFAEKAHILPQTVCRAESGKGITAVTKVKIEKVLKEEEIVVN